MRPKTVNAEIEVTVRLPHRTLTRASTVVIPVQETFVPPYQLADEVSRVAGDVVAHLKLMLPEEWIDVAAGRRRRLRREVDRHELTATDG